MPKLYLSFITLLMMHVPHAQPPVLQGAKVFEEHNPRNNVKNYHLMVYNRRGAIVFQSASLKGRNKNGKGAITLIRQLIRTNFRRVIV
jgi:hypothetical protein